MIAATDDFSDKPASPAQDAFAAAQKQPSPPAAPLAEPVSPEDALAQQVAREIMARGPRKKAPAPRSNKADFNGPAVSNVTADNEPEEIGGTGSGLRRCIVTNEVKPREQMIRFVVSPDNVITPDLEERLPGRGYWVSTQYTIMHNAVNSDAFSRAAHAKVTVPPALLDLVVTLARRACMNTLGLARRAWACDFGADNVRQALVTGKAGLVLIARNAPTDVQQKLDNLIGTLPRVTLFSTAELSAALGRESLAFASMNKGQWTLRLLIETNRLAQLLNVEKA